MKTLEVEFEEKKLDVMSKIYIKVGKLSNIEPRLLHNAFTAKYPCGTKYHSVKLEIESTEIKIRCESCDHITQIENYRFLCEKCEKPSKNLIQGEEMLIHKIEFDD
ncbi:MAG: hydrogenase maturation nickel metallochaperone HypA [Methanosarcinales archaeon]|nr:hydrogenase maturation nickel metallochaperone HypA [Methanosarcinales archaeon]